MTRINISEYVVASFIQFNCVPFDHYGVESIVCERVDKNRTYIWYAQSNNY